MSTRRTSRADRRSRPGASPEDAAVDAAEAATTSGWRIRGSWADRAEVVLPLLGYAAAVVSGMTTSSLGNLATTIGSPVPGQLGDSLAIRSDEWLTAAPLELATLANGSSMAPPLSNGPDLIYQISSGSPVETLFFAEGNFLRLGAWLPDAMLFAAFRGFPWLLLLLTLPPLLRRLGATRPMSWLAVALCFLAPASVWWSFMPVRILAFAAAGSYLLVLARDRVAGRHLVRGVLIALLAGMLLARMVTFYVPWSLSVGVPLILAVGLWLVWDRETRRPAVIAIGVGATFALLVLAAVFRENWSALQAELNTIYPGQRRVSGAPLSLHQVFGAPGLAELEDDPTPVNTNQSEVSTAFLVCGVVAAVAWTWMRPTLPRARRAAYAVLAGFTALFTAWMTLSWGDFGAHVPGLNVLLPIRASQTAGYPATILMCLVLSAVTRAEAPVARRRALAAAGVVAAITGYAVSDLRSALPHLGTFEVWAATAVTAAAVFVVVRFPRSWIPTTAVTLVALLAAVDANPILFGLAEVRTSDAADKARQFRTQALDGDFRFAADSMFTDALLVANGVPLLNGYQVTGPKRDAWAEIDPSGQYEEIWNRGASYLLIRFDGPRNAEPEVVADNFDIIRIVTEPCWLASSSFDVRKIVAQTPVQSPCATQVGEFTWYGAPQYVYQLSPKR